MMLTWMMLTWSAGLRTQPRQSVGLDEASGFALSFAAIGAYVFLGPVRQATGGNPLRLGRPIVTG